MFGKVDKGLLKELQAAGGGKAATAKSQAGGSGNFKTALQSAIVGDRKKSVSSPAPMSNNVSTDVSNSAIMGAMDTFVQVDRIDDTNLFPDSGNIFPEAQLKSDVAAMRADRNSAFSQMFTEGRLHGTSDRWDSSIAATKKPNGRHFAKRPTSSNDSMASVSTVDANLSKYDSYIKDAAATYGVDPALIKAVIVAESGGDTTARSRSGAKGLMQLMPTTAKSLGVTNIYDPQQNIAGGSRYLRQLLDRYDGNVHQALAAYNWGMGNLDRRPHKMPQQTKNYIAKVEGYYRGYSEDASMV